MVPPPPPPPEGDRSTTWRRTQTRARAGLATRPARSKPRTTARCAFLMSCVCVFVSVCVSVCVSLSLSLSVCVCVCVCVRARVRVLSVCWSPSPPPVPPTVPPTVPHRTAHLHAHAGRYDLAAANRAAATAQGNARPVDATYDHASPGGAKLGQGQGQGQGQGEPDGDGTRPTSEQIFDTAVDAALRVAEKEKEAKDLGKEPTEGRENGTTKSTKSEPTSPSKRHSSQSLMTQPPRGMEADTPRPAPPGYIKVSVGRWAGGQVGRWVGGIKVWLLLSR